MAFEIPKGAVCIAHPLENQHGDVCVDTITESLSPRSVDHMRDFYHRRYTDERDGRKDTPTITVYFEPTVGKQGTFYFLIIPGKVHGVEDQF